VAINHRQNRCTGTVRSVLTHVLGAPGSGKSAIAALLAHQLPDHVVLDWDVFMDPASELAGRDVPSSPTTWPAYRRLIRLIVESVLPAPCVLLGVCTPDELDGWPIDAWVLLDCSDEVRRKRLTGRVGAAAIDEAIADATSYRALGLPTIDTSDRAPEQVVEALARCVIELELKTQQ
jgi:broad-specificity NMP kinase